MAAATTFISVEEYLRSSFEPDAEYVDGQIEERAAELLAALQKQLDVIFLAFWRPSAPHSVQT